MALTEEEKVRIRSHMGYLNVAEAYTFVLGTPAAVQTQFLIEGAMQRVKESALPLCRQILDYLDATEGQMVGDQELLAVNRAGDIEIDPEEQEKLDRRYNRWVAQLSNLLGCPRNPFDKRFGAGGRVGNVSVGG